MNAALKHMTPDAFMVWCLDQPERWELVHGIPICMMNGATQRHDSVVVNVIANVSTQLKGRSCRVKTSNIASQMACGNIRRPDVTVDCGSADRKSLKSAAPTVFFEVLSPSTRTFDQFRKTEEYKAVPTLRHIVLIDPDRPRVWLWSRADEATTWTDQDIDGLEAEVDLSAIDVMLPMAEIYEGVTLED